MRTIIVRCQSGTVVWVRESPSRLVTHWRCTRDNFTVAEPADTTQIEPFLVQLAQHSVSLSGQLVQVVELDL